MSKTVQTSGFRKRAKARATVTSGTGKIVINGVVLERWGNAMNRMRIMEPVLLAGEPAKKLDVIIRSNGGGTTGQADGIRLAIGRPLTQHNEKMRSVLLEYDRMLLVADVRRKESAKPNSHGQARSKCQKSYR